MGYNNHTSDDAVAAQAHAMVTISCVLSVPALLASLPVVYVLRKHWRRFVCYPCCHNPLRRPPRATESDIVLSLLLCLQTADLIFAVGFLLSVFNDNEMICALQGALLQAAGPCAMLFSSCLSMEFFIVIRSIVRGQSSASRARCRLSLYLLYTLTFAGTFFVIDLVVDGFGRIDTSEREDNAWCWVHGMQGWGGTVSFLSYYGIAAVAMVTVLVFYSLVMYHVARRIGVSRVSQPALSPSYPGVAGADPEEHAAASRRLTRQLKRTVCKVGIYPLLLFFTLLPGMIHRLPAFLGMPFDKVGPLMLWHAGTMPLLGLTDAIILAVANVHVRVRLLDCLRCRPEMNEREHTKWRTRSSFAQASLDRLDHYLAHDDRDDARSVGSAENPESGGAEEGRRTSLNIDTRGSRGMRQHSDYSDYPDDERALIETLRWSDEETEHEFGDYSFDDGMGPLPSPHDRYSLFQDPR